MLGILLLLPLRSWMEEAFPADYLNPGKAFLHAGCQWGLCEIEVVALVLTGQAHNFAHKTTCCILVGFLVSEAGNVMDENNMNAN